MNVNLVRKKLLKNKYVLNSLRTYHSEKVFGHTSKIVEKYTVSEKDLENRSNESNFYRLVSAYRQHAHKCADINPVSITKTISAVPELDLSRYNLKESDTVSYRSILNIDKTKGTVKEALEFLNNVYCKHVSAEFLHLENEEEIEWFTKRLEQLAFESVDAETKKQIATDLLKSECFDNFLAKKFTGLKRYGGEGAESMMSFFHEIFKLGAEDSIEQMVLAMPHRGRLNLLTGLLNFSPARMFHKIKGFRDISLKYKSTGDVLSHLISSTDLKFGEKSIHVSMLYCPSHLEIVNPMSMGKTRAKQMDSKDGDYGENRRWSDKVLNIQVHGDAAIMGQGLNQECLTFSRTPHFEIGGTVHLVVNNQVGFTTPSERGRSSKYCTDIAKMVAAPIIHINGDHPENVLLATRLAFEYQRRFRKDIFIDLNCFRQWGHNELDDPTFTNPLLYSIIRNRRTVPDMYALKLINEGVMKKEELDQIIETYSNTLNEELSKSENYTPEDLSFKKLWEGFGQAQDVIQVWDTGIDLDMMTFIGEKSVKVPNNFEVHPTLMRGHVKSRLNKIGDGINIDWATAESLAIGSLLFDGYNVRISGQDVGRGTFSHRHAMLVDQKTNTIHVPLNHLHENQTGFFEVANSVLSEESVLAYEYGMSVESPKNLIIWEAQFGDFFNGAQIVFDTLISAGEDKWMWSSGLTCLLPHGYDGAGPEHSSSRVERFLQLTDSKEDGVDGDNVNMQVCQPSTPAQYFHLLRRQMVRNYRKPLIVITPKTLLRLSNCTSTFAEMAHGTYFKPVLDEKDINPTAVKKVLLTSGKHYYSLAEKRKSMGVKDTAILRIESFSPFPTSELRTELAKFPNANCFIWCQEEPQNMGAWSFVKPRFQNMVRKQISYCGRLTQAAPAVGFGEEHRRQVEEILTQPFMME